MINRKNILSNIADFERAAHMISAYTGKSDSQIMFFDIETTGLSPLSSFLYLIGCLYEENGTVILEQFFSEGIEDEPALLEAFGSLLSRHDVLVHFNGQTFDIPYIEKKCSKLGINGPLSCEYTSVDIFKAIRSYKRFLGLSSMSQKSLEVYLGLNREDIYDGGQLIEVYGKYIAVKRLEDVRSRMGKSSPDSLPESEELLRILLLHNYEDVLGMLEVIRMLALPATLLGKYNILKASALLPSGEEADFSGICGAYTLRIAITPSFPDALLFFNQKTVTCPGGEIIHITKFSNDLILDIPISSSEMKFFYSDYRNYYYLPAEDNAIHKSIGDFLDKSLRCKCTPANCYTKSCGPFVPLAHKPGKDSDCSFELFRPEYKTSCYFTTVSGLLEDSCKLREYVVSIMANI